MRDLVALAGREKSGCGSAAVPTCCSPFRKGRVECTSATYMRLRARGEIADAIAFGHAISLRKLRYLGASCLRGFGISEDRASHGDFVRRNFINHIDVGLADRASAVINETSGIAAFRKGNAHQRIMCERPFNCFPCSLCVGVLANGKINCFPHTFITDNGTRARH